MAEQEQSPEQFRFNANAVVMRISETVAGHSLDGDLAAAAEYLAKSPTHEGRADTKFPQLAELTDEQKQDIRTDAAKIGIGAEKSIGLAEAGLPEGTTVMLEAGLPNKVLAQFKMIMENDVEPGMIGLTASKIVKVGKLDIDRMQQVAAQLGVEAPDIAGKTQYEAEAITLGLYPDFEPIEPVVLPFGYELHDGHITPNTETDGKVVQVGNAKGKPVIFFVADELHRDDSGGNFYRPAVGDFEELANQVATSFNAEAAELPVASVTSHLYSPSCRLESQNTLVYGTEVMDEVVGSKSTPSLENIISEIDRTREVLLEQAK